MERDNSGVLFKNDRKEAENHPDYRGGVTVAGVEYYLSAWIRTSKKEGGGKFMSLALSPKVDAGNRAVDQAKKAVNKDFDDDIPF